MKSFLLILSLFATILSADTVSPNFNDDFLEKRSAELSREKVPTLEAYAEKKMANAKVSFARNKNEGYRDLGDVWHFLGHLAERDLDFSLAHSYHERAIENYLLAGGLQAFGSWDDGLTHAREHLFVDLVEMGLQLEAKSKTKQARYKFNAAVELESKYELSDTADLRYVNRFYMRYLELAARGLVPYYENEFWEKELNFQTRSKMGCMKSFVSKSK